jgi:hypothetical protein
MVEYVVNAVPGDEMEYFKMPFLSCEVFCALIKDINDALFNDDMRALLFSFFENKSYDNGNVMPISSHVGSNVARVVMIHIVKDLKGVHNFFFLLNKLLYFFILVILFYFIFFFLACGFYRGKKNCTTYCKTS